MSTEHDDIRDEVLRIRDRVHTIQADIQGLTFDVRDMRSWRERIQPIIDELREADHIAAAVAEKMRDLQTAGLTNVQRRTAVVAAVVLSLSFIADLADRVFHFING